MRESSTNRVWALGLALAFAVIYGLSASRTVIFNNLDAAEFQTVGVVGGVPHQPYPLWCIVARAFSALPVFEPAFRVTLVSVVFGALCVGLLFLLLLRRSGSRAAAAGVASAFGLSFTFWQFSAVAEVYALMTFLFVASLYLIDRLAREDSERTVLLLAMVLGLLLSQQTLNAAAVPGLLLLLFAVPSVRHRLLGGPRPWLCVAAFVLPVTLYAYTFLVDRGPYPMNWLDHYGRYVAASQGVDASQMDSFLGRVRFQMTIGRLKPEIPGLAEYAGAAYYWVRYFVSVEFPFVAPLLAVVGLVSSWRRDARFTAFLIVLALPYLMLALTNWGEVHAYSFPVYVVAMIFVADGIATAGRISRRGTLVPVVVALLVTIAPLLRYSKASPVSRWLRSDEAIAAIEHSPHAFLNLEARNNDGRTYGEKVAEMVEPGSLIFGGWRQTNVLFYHQLVDGALDSVTVSYWLPEWRQTEGMFERLQPTKVYFTFPPEKRGFDRLAVEEARDVVAGERLYTVRVAGAGENP
jgi:hypothetical protein